MSGSKATIPGRIVGYVLVVVVVAAAARVVWELLAPLVPFLSGLLVLVGIGWFVLSLRRGS